MQLLNVDIPRNEAPGFLTQQIVERMGAIIAEACTVSMLLERSEEVHIGDRDALLRIASRIGAQADVVLDWLEEAPLEVARN